MKLHVNWGHESARQVKRVLVNSAGETMHLVNYEDEVLEHCEARRAFEKAPHELSVGPSTASTPSEKLQVDSTFSDDAIALRATDVCSKRSLLIRVSPENPQEVRDAFYNAWIGVFGQPKGN